MAKAINTKKSGVKKTTTAPTAVQKPKRVARKEYVVVLGTPSFYIIQLEDGTQKTIQASNTYKRGDIVKL